MPVPEMNPRYGLPTHFSLLLCAFYDQPSQAHYSHIEEHQRRAGQR